MNEEREHAILSASAAHRWLLCTPSARLEETLPEATSSYAEEGRLAHAVAELKLRKYFTPIGQGAFTKAFNKLKKGSAYRPEMDKFTDDYVDYVKRCSMSFGNVPYAVIEARVDYSDYAPEGFGTADCILIHSHTLWVIDFKYGQGVPVSAESNPQMSLYSLGALSRYGMLYDIDTVNMSIVQPRLDSISEWQISAAELRAWGETVKLRAQMAFAGDGEYIAGDHCRFCRAKAVCRARADENLLMASYDFAKPETLTLDEISVILEKAKELAKWAADVEEYALSQALAGETIPGWKVVEGRSIRRFADNEKAFQLLTTAGIDEAMLYERKPLTLAAIEKLLGKQVFSDLLADEVEVPPGKPALVPETDKRPAMREMQIQDDFKEEL